MKRENGEGVEGLSARHLRGAGERRAGFSARHVSAWFSQGIALHVSLKTLARLRPRAPASKRLDPKLHQKLMRRLLLGRASCRQFLAALAAMTIAAGEAGEEADACRPSSAGDLSEETPHNNGQLFAYAMVMVATWAMIRLWDWWHKPLPQLSEKGESKGRQRSCGMPPHMEPRRTRSVASQAQTTYTAVRGATTPRFLPLPEHCHG